MQAARKSASGSAPGGRRAWAGNAEALRAYSPAPEGEQTPTASRSGDMLLMNLTRRRCRVEGPGLCGRISGPVSMIG